MEENKKDIEAEVINLEELKTNQGRNTFIKNRQSSFVSLCNKILDFLYDARDREEKKHFLSKTELEDVTSFAEEIENIRKKIQMSAPLEDIEIVRLLLCAQFVKADLERLIKEYTSAVEILDSYIKILN